MTFVTLLIFYIPIYIVRCDFGRTRLLTRHFLFIYIYFFPLHIFGSSRYSFFFSLCSSTPVQIRPSPAHIYIKIQHLHLNVYNLSRNAVYKVLQRVLTVINYNHAHHLSIYVYNTHSMCTSCCIISYMASVIRIRIFQKSPLRRHAVHIYRYTRIKYINHIRIYLNIYYIAAAYTYIALRPLSLVNSKRVEVRNTIYFTVRPSFVMGFHMYVYI